MRAMGVRNPLMLDLPDEDKVMKVMTSSSAKMDESVGGPVKLKPGSGLGGGVPVYQKEPKKTGAQLPKLPKA